MSWQTNKQGQKARYYLVVVEPSPIRWRTAYAVGPFRWRWCAKMGALLAFLLYLGHGEVTVWGGDDLKAPLLHRGRLKVWPRGKS